MSIIKLSATCVAQILFQESGTNVQSAPYLTYVRNVKKNSVMITI